MTTAVRASVAAFVLALPGAIQAEFCSANPAPQEWRRQFQFFAGYSPATATLIGVETDRRFALVGLSFSYRCWAWSSVSLSYTTAVMPAAILIEPSHSVYGVAVTPVGFTLDFHRRRRLYHFKLAGIFNRRSGQGILRPDHDPAGLFGSHPHHHHSRSDAAARCAAPEAG